MKQEIFCEAMNSFGQWEKVCIWHDGSKNNYPEETWNLFLKEYRGTGWKKIRMVKESVERKILKTKNLQ